METQTSRTLAPWVVNKDGHIYGPDGKAVVFFGWEEMPENYEANRTFIVNAVNLHGLLSRTLREHHDEVKKRMPHETCNVCELLVKAEVA